MRWTSRICKDTHRFQNIACRFCAQISSVKNSTQSRVWPDRLEYCRSACHIRNDLLSQSVLRSCMIALEPLCTSKTSDRSSDGEQEAISASETFPIADTTTSRPSARESLRLSQSLANKSSVFSAFIFI